jgi:hypothetical protein
MMHDAVRVGWWDRVAPKGMPRQAQSRGIIDNVTSPVARTLGELSCIHERCIASRYWYISNTTPLSTASYWLGTG